VGGQLILVRDFHVDPSGVDIPVYLEAAFGRLHVEHALFTFAANEAGSTEANT
jgi:hypothetical protein